MVYFLHEVVQDIPYGSVTTYGIHPQACIVGLHGICEESPIRIVTCSQKMLEHGDRLTRHSLSLGWIDFVKENV